MSIGQFRGISNAIWPLDGNSNDVSGNANNGTDSNMSYGLGRFGDAGVFNGSTARISLPNNAGLRPSTFTVSCWYKGTGYGTLLENMTLLSSKYYGFLFDIYPTHIPRLVIFKGTGAVPGTDFQSADAVTAINDDKWHFLVGTFDGSYIKFYVDGKLEGSTAWTTIGYTATQYPMIGCRQDTVGAYGYYLTGSADEFILRPSVWTDSFVYCIYAYAKGMLV